MKGKGKMKVVFLILIAAVNLFMHVNSTEKRRITCGKRATFLYIFSSLGQLNSIPQVNFWHELFPSLFCLVPSRSRFPLALYACSHHPSLAHLACLSRLVSLLASSPIPTQPWESLWRRQFLIDFLYLCIYLTSN